LGLATLGIEPIWMDHDVAEMYRDMRFWLEQAEAALRNAEA
jgi:hypothetical protein